MKLAIILTLIASLLMPQSIKAQSAQPDNKKSLLIVGCVALAVGGVVVVCLWQVCKKIPDPNLPQPPSPPTNYPSINWTNQLGPDWHGDYPPKGWISPRGTIAESFQPRQGQLSQPIPFDVSQWQRSTNSGSQPPLVTNGVFDTFWSVTLESSIDTVHWAPVAQTYVYECHSGNYLFSDSSTSGVAGYLLNTYSGKYDAVTNRTPIFTGYRSDYDQTCVIPQDAFQLKEKPQEFFRWVQP